jgi:hypothetical protein
MARSTTPSLVASGRRAADKATDAAREARDAWHDAAEQVVRGGRKAANEAKLGGRKAAKEAKLGGRKAAKRARSAWQEVSDAVESAAVRTRRAASDTLDGAHGLGREAGRRARDTREALAGRTPPKPRRRFTVIAVLAGIGLGAAASAVGRHLATRNAKRLERLEARLVEADPLTDDPTLPVGSEAEPRLNGVGTAERLGTVTDTADRPVLHVPPQPPSRPGTPAAGATTPPAAAGTPAADPATPPSTPTAAPADVPAPRKPIRSAGGMGKEPVRDPVEDPDNRA